MSSVGPPSLGFHGNTIIPHANWALIRAAIMVWREKEVVHVCELGWGVVWGEGVVRVCVSPQTTEKYTYLPC